MLPAAIALLAAPALAADAPAADDAAILAFEAPGWTLPPGGAVALDSTVVHAGTQALRLTRDARADGPFTAVSRARPVDFRGHTARLEGYLRTEGVTGWAGLWLRGDGGGEVLGFDNMQDRAATGTADWRPFAVEVRLTGAEDRLVFGALLAGEGTVWVDDLVLLVDGRPVAEAKPRRRVDAPPPAPAVRAASGLAIPPLTPEQADHVALLGRVWSFVGAHHPALASGAVDDEAALFRALPPVLAAADAPAARAAIVAWLDALGPAPTCRPRRCATAPGDPQLAADLAWIHDRALLGEALAARLEQVYANRYTGDRPAVQLAPQVGNPVFAWGPYPDVPDTGDRVLALLRFWSVIQWWYPYRDHLDRDWADVLREHLPAVVDAADPVAFRRAMIEVAAEVHDTHTNVWSALSEAQPPLGGCAIPGGVRFLDGQAVVFDAPEGGPLVRGDIVVAVDGAEVPALVAAWSPAYPASNEPTRLRDIGERLLYGACGPATLTVDRGAGPLPLDTERTRVTTRARHPHDRPGDTLVRLSDDVAYLKLSSIRLDAIPAQLASIEGVGGLVVDIRGYPSEFVVYGLTGHLLAAPTPIATFTQVDLANPGTFVWTGAVSVPPIAPQFPGRVVVLVDESTQSQAEYTAMALRAVPGTVIVGSTTAGADGNVSAVPLPGGDALITGIGVFYPDRTPTQRIGIVPDIQIRPTLDGVRAGRDEVLEAALRVLAEPAP